MVNAAIICYSFISLVAGLIIGDTWNWYRNKKYLRKIETENKLLLDQRENYLQYQRSNGIESAVNKFQKLNEEITELRKIIAQNKFKGSGKK